MYTALEKMLNTGFSTKITRLQFISKLDLEQFNIIMATVQNIASNTQIEGQGIHMCLDNPDL